MSPVFRFPVALRRMRGVFALRVTLGLVCLIAASATVLAFADAGRRLDGAAQSDPASLVWSLSQTEVALLDLNIAMRDAIGRPADAGALAALRRAYGMARGRIDLADEGHLPPVPSLSRSRAFLARHADLVAGDDAALRAALPDLRAQTAALTDSLHPELLTAADAVTGQTRQDRSSLRAALHAAGAASLLLSVLLAALALMPGRPAPAATRDAAGDAALGEARGAVTLPDSPAPPDQDAKSRFLAVMSHEMRTPLNGLIAAAELLQNSTQLDQRQQWLSEIVLTCGWTALDQVNNVLELTRLGAKDGPGYPALPFSPWQVIRDVVAQHQQPAAMRGTNLQVADPAAEIPLVTGPRQLFLRVIHNLISNAVKFTDGGTVSVTMQARQQGDHLWLSVSVIDTGIGIASADLERIFHNFETLDASYARMREGTGLGLGIAKLSAEAMGGEISVRSSPGAGSTFTLEVTLPIAKATSTIPTAPAGTAPAQLPLQVLLAEDNPINSLLLAEMLRLRGHSVTTAPDGIKAVELATKTRFDLILMDIAMPGMDGLEATRRIRRGGASKKVPIIAVTAHGGPDRLPEFIGAGLTDVLVKPITHGALTQLMQSYGPTTRFDPPPAGAGIPAADPASEAGPLINQKVFGETLSEMGRDFVEPLAARLLDEAAALPPRLSDLMAAGNFQAAGQAAHRTAGAAAAIGLSGIYEALAACEQAALSQDRDTAEARIAALPDLVDRTRAALRDQGLTLPPVKPD